jgi:KDO2-lipid IV(A) lauroyltransferase
MSRHSPLRRLGFAVETGVSKVTLALTRRVSTARLIAFAAWAGAIVGRRAPMARKRIEANLKQIRPDMTAAERADLAAEVGAGLLMTGVEYMRMAELAARPDIVTVTGEAYVAEALAAGRPIVFVTAHFGQWEFIRICARRLGAETAIIYRAFNNPGIDALAQDFIATAGEPVLHKGPAGARRLLRQIAKGGAALILVDQRQTGSPLIPFMGKDAETATAAADLALRFNAALIPARVRRVVGAELYELRFEAPIAPQDATEMMAEVNARIGAWVQDDPSQWFWLHRRWKLRPRGVRQRAESDRTG